LLDFESISKIDILNVWSISRLWMQLATFTLPLRTKSSNNNNNEKLPNYAPCNVKQSNWVSFLIIIINRCRVQQIRTVPTKNIIKSNKIKSNKSLKGYFQTTTAQYQVPNTKYQVPFSLKTHIHTRIYKLLSHNRI